MAEEPRRRSTMKLMIDEVRKSFRAGSEQFQVLDGVTFDVAPGEFVAILGPSGCGKSTLFNVVAGLERPASGRVIVDGADTTGRSEPFAYMPQQDLLFPWRTVLDNTTLGLEVAGMRRQAARLKARKLFEQFGLSGFESAHPFELSGGMRQRVALLRTVVQDRAVLLLDEPFGALDSLTRTDMQMWLNGVRGHFDWTVLMITHDIREAVFLADRVVVLGRRPTRVRYDVVVGLPQPRSVEMITTARFAAVEVELLAALHGHRSEPGY